MNSMMADSLVITTDCCFIFKKDFLSNCYIIIHSTYLYNNKYCGYDFALSICTLYVQLRCPVFKFQNILSILILREIHTIYINRFGCVSLLFTCFPKKRVSAVHGNNDHLWLIIHTLCNLSFKLRTHTHPRSTIERAQNGP